MIMQETDKKNTNNGGLWLVGLIIVLTLIWIVAGIAAFIMSLVCFGKSGTTAQKIVGLVLSCFIGPFYWIYYGVLKDYCR
jgi:uncharacterized membrane-anchored protein